MVSNAFYLIDKPLNFTSFDVINVLRKKLNIRRIWHTWTLDPLASGALLIATWKYTKLIPYFEKDTKEYEFEIALDWTSASYDLWTQVKYISSLEQKQFEQLITKEKISQILKKSFTWKITQIPPKYSAIKIEWKKSLNRLLDWEDFEMKKRECEVYQIDLLDYKYPYIKIIAKVSAGTYIRSIANDLWKILWTWGYITSLRRIKIWKLMVDEAMILEDFDAMNYLQVEKLFNVDFISLNREEIEQINNGQMVKWEYNFNINKPLFIVQDWEITNIIEYDWNSLIPKKRL